LGRAAGRSPVGPGRCTSCRRLAWPTASLLPKIAAALGAPGRAVVRGVVEEGVDPGGAGRVHDDDRIRLRRLDAPVELEAQAAVGAWRVADVLLRPFDLHEAERDGFGDALGVVRRALAVEDGAHGLAARSGRA